jgi:hypothetical protein
MNDNETIKDLMNQLKQRDEKIKRLKDNYNSLLFLHVVETIIIIFNILNNGLC